ncbi:uncharacterized protein LOC121368889 [Gigantopelta aegis]|uniref:uncharacterized protein LOC121368889 n=1 Tax=Gigantopelta aegis TaxID=1735272 RepID=UPI001B88E6B2|nr:uncharacterized protein LOC121368889 [Gigantopelta aegis]
MDEAAEVQENVAADVSTLRESSQCAGVSLLDMGSISFDSFLASSATLIPQFIFDSIDVMQHDKRLATSTSCESSSTDSCSSPSEVSHNTLQMTTSPEQISPSKQILELICGIDVAGHCEKSDTEPDDNRQTHSQRVITAEFSDSILSSPDNASVSDSPGSMNTAYYESPDPSGNDNLTSVIASNPGYNTAVKTPPFIVHEECSVESISSLGSHLEHKTAISNQETSSAECLLF